MSGDAEAKWRKRFRAPTISLPVWARNQPDRCTYLSNASGSMQAYVWDRATGEHRQLSDAPGGTLFGALPAPDGETVWWFRDRRGSEFGQWWAQPFAGGEATTPDVPAGYPEGAAIGGDLVALAVAGDGIHRVHLVEADGTARVAHRSPEAVSVGSFSYDDSLVTIEHAEHGDSRNRAVRVLGRDGSAVAELWDGPGRGVSASGWARASGDQRLIVLRDASGYRRPWLWSPLSGDLEELDLPAEGDIGASWWPGNEALLLRRLWRGRVELSRLDLATGAIEPLDHPAGIITGARVRDDGELWLAYSSSSTPPTVRCGDTELRPPGDVEPAPTGVPYQDLQVGDVHAFLAEPPDGGVGGDRVVGGAGGGAGRPRPTVFQVHGGPAGLDGDSFSPRVQAWVDHGFAVVLVNYRGSSGYGKDWEDAIVGQPGLLETEDLVAVRDHVVAEAIADPDRVVLAGGSWGGYLTLLGLGREPGSWSAGISIVPLADLAAHYHQQSEPLQAYWRALFGGTPDEIGDLLAQNSPIEFAARVDAPLLIECGDNDPRCPLGQVQNYVARLEALGKPHEFHHVDEGHASLEIDAQIEKSVRWLDFCHRWLDTPTAT